MQPALRCDGGGGFGWFLVIAFHVAVAADQQLALLTHRQRIGRPRRDDLHFQARQNLADRADAVLQAVGRLRLRDDGRGFGQAVGNRHVARAHLARDRSHDLDGTRSAGHDAGPEARQIELAEARMVQLGDKHGRHAEDAGAALVLNR